MATEDSQRQAIVARAIRAVQGWQIRVDIWLLTNDPGNLTAALEQHHVLAAPGQCGGRLQPPLRPLGVDFARNPLMLAYAHRGVLEREHRGYDLFAYLEEDMEMPWSHVVAWGEDEYLLGQAGLPFHRGFFRWETREDGSRTVTDFRACMFDFTTHRCKVDVKGRLFIGLRNPYYAAWLMTRPRLEAFRNSSMWRWDKSKCAQHGLQIRECAASGDAYDFKMTGAEGMGDCKSSHLVRVKASSSGTGPSLSALSGLHHLGQNKHSVRPAEWTFEGCLNRSLS